MEILWLFTAIIMTFGGFLGAYLYSDVGQPMWRFVLACVVLALGATSLVGGVLYYKDRALECETLIETNATIGDVEICIPTPDAVDIVEEYQNAD